MKLSHPFMLLATSIIVLGANQGWAEEPMKPSYSRSYTRAGAPTGSHTGASGAGASHHPTAPRKEVKAPAKHEGGDGKASAPHFLAGKSYDMRGLGAIQSIYIKEFTEMWTRTAGASGVLTFAIKERGGFPYPHITFGKDSLNGEVAVHYSVSPTARVQFRYDLIHGRFIDANGTVEGTVSELDQEWARKRVGHFMQKFQKKVDETLETLNQRTII